MKIGHAPAELLAGYADGSLSDGMCLVIAAHLTFCPDCRRRLARLEALGGALLVEPGPRCCAGPDLANVLNLLDQPERAAPVPPPRGRCAALADLPRCLGERLDSALDESGWHQGPNGLEFVPIPICGEGALTLLRGKPGLRLAGHDHRGIEATLILRGALRDGAREFGRGDLVLAGPGSHAPEVVGDGAYLALLFRDPA